MKALKAGNMLFNSEWSRTSRYLVRLAYQATLGWVLTPRLRTTGPHVGDSDLVIV